MMYQKKKQENYWLKRADIENNLSKLLAKITGITLKNVVNGEYETIEFQYADGTYDISEGKGKRIMLTAHSFSFFLPLEEYGVAAALAFRLFAIRNRKGKDFYEENKNYNVYSDVMYSECDDFLAKMVTK